MSVVSLHQQPLPPAPKRPVRRTNLPFTQKFLTSREDIREIKIHVYGNTVADPDLQITGGGGGGGGGTPLLFLDQTGARRARKIFLETGPPPPYLRVWMTGRHPATVIYKVGR